jgi:hypothetical protein
MKQKNSVGTTSGKDQTAAAALAEARERVKAVKKQVKDAKAGLKAARVDLKAAKKARKLAEARREAEVAKMSPRRRRTPSNSLTTGAVQGAPQLRSIAVRRMRRRPANSSSEGSAVPMEDGAPGAMPVLIESEQVHTP